VDERLCLPVPTGFSFEEAASLPEAVFTVWFNVFKQAGLRVGEHFLVHEAAAASGDGDTDGNCPGLEGFYYGRYG